MVARVRSEIVTASAVPAELRRPVTPTERRGATLGMANHPGGLTMRDADLLHPHRIAGAFLFVVLWLLAAPRAAGLRREGLPEWVGPAARARSAGP
jgi:hypothetical protein